MMLSVFAGGFVYYIHRYIMASYSNDLVIAFRPIYTETRMCCACRCVCVCVCVCRVCLSCACHGVSTLRIIVVLRDTMFRTH